MSDLVISDGSAAGTNVNLTDGGSLTTVGNHTLVDALGYSVYLKNVDNSSISDLDLSWTADSTRRGTGLHVDAGSDNLTIEDLTASTRRRGIYVHGGSDVRVYDNDLSNSGVSTNEAALQLHTITAASLVGGIEVYGNDFSDSGYGVSLVNLSNLVISDGSAAGTNVNLTDGGSLSTVGTHTLNTVSGMPLYIHNVDDTTVDSLDLSWAKTATRTGYGFHSNSSSDNLTIQNLTASTRRRGIYVNGGTDVRAYNNDVSNSGVSTNEAALQLQSIAAATLSGGIEVYGNDFSDSSYGVSLNNFSGLVISDGSAAGTNVNLTDGGSLSTVGTHTLNTANGIALYINNVDDTTVDSLDLSWPKNATRTGYGLHSNNSSDNLTIQNLTASTRRRVIYVNGGTDVRVYNNDVTDSGVSTNEAAIQLQSIASGSLGGGIEVYGNDLTDSVYGVRLVTFSDLVISDGSVAGTNVNLTDGGSLSTIGTHTLTTVNGTALYLHNVDDTTVDSSDLSWSKNSSRTGYGLHSNNSSDNLTIQNLTASTRRRGIYVNGGTDVRVHNNDVSDSGVSTHEAALQLQSIGSGLLGGGIEVYGNDLTDSPFGVSFSNLSDLVISDGSVAGTNVNLTDGGSLSTVGTHTLNTASGTPFTSITWMTPPLIRWICHGRRAPAQPAMACTRTTRRTI